MNRRGFALLAALWVISALTVVTGISVLAARVGSDATRNRILLARAEWAREACGDIVAARLAANPAIRVVDTIDLGRGTWCRAALDDPAARLDLNTADQDAIARLLRAIHVASAMADSVIAYRRRRTAIYDVQQIPGIDSAITARLAPFVTTRGTGAINVNSAPTEVLGTMPELTEEAVSVIVRHRTVQRLENADELVALLPGASKSTLLSSYAAFVRAATFTPPQLIVTLEGGVHGSALRARATLTAVLVPGRLAVVRRETE